VAYGTAGQANTVTAGAGGSTPCPTPGGFLCASGGVGGGGGQGGSFGLSQDQEEPSDPAPNGTTGASGAPGGTGAAGAAGTPSFAACTEPPCGGANLAPLAVDDSYTAAGSSLVVPVGTGVLANDTDGDGDPLVAVLGDPPASGTLSLQPDGSFTYTPSPGFTGEQTFSYRATDGNGGTSELATVTIDVVGTTPVADFDGDGDSDIGVFRPSIGRWFIRGGISPTFGQDGDVPVPADYDGDGDTDIAVYRPTTSQWLVRQGITATFGQTGDVPVPADYDGDGDTDIAVFRPSIGRWFIRGGASPTFGETGDIPVPADYDGDGDTDIAVFRPTIARWFIRGSISPTYGQNGDIPVSAPGHLLHGLATS
jgi:hypothetical protein